MKKSENSPIGMYFLLIVIAFYIITAIVRFEMVLPSLKFSLGIFKKIIPIFFLIFVLMVIINRFITPNAVKDYLGKSSGIKDGSLLSSEG